MIFLRVDGQEVCGRGAIRAAPSDRANRCGPPQYGTYSSEVWLGVPKTDSAIIVTKASQQRLRCDSAEALNRPMDRGIDVFAYHYNWRIRDGQHRAKDPTQQRFAPELPDV